MHLYLLIHTYIYMHVCYNNHSGRETINLRVWEWEHRDREREIILPEGMKEKSEMMQLYLIKTYKSIRNSENVLRKKYQTKKHKASWLEGIWFSGWGGLNEKCSRKISGFLATGLTLGTVRDPVSNE